MLIGYNTNVPYKGKTYHVQTEDSGLSNPCIVTLLYRSGAILRSIKTSYGHLLGSPDLEQQIREMMKHQHREMIRELVKGKCDIRQSEREKEPSAEAEEKAVMTVEQESAPKELKKSLDEILLEHIAKKVKKR